MSDRYLERITESFTHYPPLVFAYDTKTKTFAVGDDNVPIQSYAGYIPAMSEKISLEAAQKLIDTSSLLLNIFDNHFQMPVMTDWIKSLSAKKWEDARSHVAESMVDVYAQLTDMPRKYLLKDTFMGFGATLYRPGHPVFNVVGNCACYGVSPHGNLFDEHYWDAGFAEYEAHNIDNQAQITALHAGAGALAAMVER